jgi:hypothetical protein
MESTLVTSASRRDSNRTPWPTIPEAPKMITFILIITALCADAPGVG